MLILSQRDPRWAAAKLGQSNESVGRSGCTTTDISMASSYFNRYKNPGVLARTLTYTKDGLIVWSSLGNIGLRLEKRFYGRQDNIIREALSNPKKVVILQVENYHWVLGLGRNLFGGYRIADPWYGDKSTSKRYKSITGGAVITIQ